jgi:hypothetical protein
MTTDFFDKMPSISEFSALTKEGSYQPAPADWWVVITDVQGSTLAIEEGRYKEVNTIGAATLAAIKNAVGDLSIPFVFGGDGASALIPSEVKPAVQRELSSLRSLAQKSFHLDLRVGMISVAELQEKYGPLFVGKYALASNYPLAIFRGGTLAKADKLIKEQRERYEVPSFEYTETDLSSLSCRWKALPSSHGQILCLLIVAHNDDASVYEDVLADLEKIMAPGMAAANPVNPIKMRYRSLGEMLRYDRKHQVSFGKLLQRQLMTVAAFILFRFGIGKMLPLLARYLENIAEHSDFRKFDDMLRMVLDCSHDQIEAIHLLLNEYQKNKLLSYGTSLSSNALMTCFVSGFGDGQHIHFIDGDDGGYAIAAKALKERALAEPS